MSHSKKCFVIMPIKKSGSSEWRHYRALFDNVIRPAIAPLGYDVKRADDFQKSGSITKDIILPLAYSDLVVADLTGLNANVFYELGVRHVLRGSGSIMILDERETEVPFDINAYRVIKFRSDMEGIGVLSAELSKFARQFESGAVDSRDNLVHDLLPNLPINVLASAEGSQEGELRQEIQSLRRQLKAYSNRFGDIHESAYREDPLDVVHQALAEARDGNLPSLLVDQAEKLAEAGKHRDFLETVVRFVEIKTSKPSPKSIMRLLRGASILDLSTVREAILDHACSLYPGNRDLRLLHQQTFAHSEDPQKRSAAREEFQKELGMSINNGKVVLDKELSGMDFNTFGVMLDAFHRDELHEEAFRLASALAESYPKKAAILRNLGRAYHRMGNQDEALKYYIKAALVPDSDDTAGVWLGNELHNRGRYVDAAEAYTLACLRDPDDPSNFMHLAEELSLALAESEVGSPGGKRGLPSGLGERDMIVSVLVAGLACGQINSDILERMKVACRRVELDTEEIILQVQSPADSSVLRRRTRIDLVKNIREVLRSDLTDFRKKVDLEASSEGEQAVS